jgi:hypothetical protein
MNGKAYKKEKFSELLAMINCLSIALSTMDRGRAGDLAWD